MSGETPPPPVDAGEAFGSVILKACAYDAKERYQTPEKFREALEEIRYGAANREQGVHEKPKPVEERPVPESMPKFLQEGAARQLARTSQLNTEAIRQARRNPAPVSVQPEKPTAGEINFHAPTEASSHSQLSTSNSPLSLGYLPQYNTIDRKFPISVEEVILSGLSIQKSLTSRFTPEQREKGKHIITRMGLEGLEHRSIGQLSGGQLQRALLGRAIISDPSVLILDEPSTYIDKRFEARLYELLAEINKECAIILVSHDIGTVLQQVKSIACVNETLDYHPDTGVSTEWLERNFNCPIELLGHGTLPHRVLGEHHHHH